MRPIRTALLIAALAGLFPVPGPADTAGEGVAVVSSRAREIEGLLALFAASGSEEEQASVAGVLGSLRAAEAAGPLVARLVELHRQAPSPFRDSEAKGHGLAVALVEALKQIGRPALDPFLEALATWEGYALDLTWAYAAVHEEEGLLVLRHRARSEPNRERRARLQSAAWFSRLRAPGLQEDSGPMEPASTISTPRTR